MPGTREVKRRIKSIGSTKKITRAMQMVSAAKMRRAQNAVTASRPYAALARELANNLSGLAGEDSAESLAGAKAKTAALVVMTANRGQVGALNANVIAAARNFIEEQQALGVAVEIFTLGKKARDGVFRLGYTVQAEFNKADRGQRTTLDIRAIASMATRNFLNGSYSSLYVAYPQFVSTLTQRPAVEQVLPFEEDAAVGETHKHKKESPYLFEPNPEAVLASLLPRIVEASLYRALLESDASEHSARMVMMKNATDAAGDLVDDLTLAYNRLRQANITKELAEITAGRIAME